MQASQDRANLALTRLDREKAYWDRVYGSDGNTPEKLAWMQYVEETTFNARFFADLLKPLRRGHLLSIGGGVDRLGVALAQAGHRVVCVDISPLASAHTWALAHQAGVAGHLMVQSSGCEEMTFPPETFDLVVCKRALHHMVIPEVIPTVHAVLKSGGTFIAEEPICLQRLVRWLHDRFPFYGDAPHTPDERELTQRELALIQKAFRTTRFFYFDFLARESVAFHLHRRRWGRLLYLLGQTDFHLVNRLLPVLRRLCNYVIIHAVK